MLLIDSVYIHESGGKSLLVYFLKELQQQKKEFYVLLDSRINPDITQVISSNNYEFIKASERNRKKFYQSNDIKYTVIFCFANVPPPISIQHIPVYIFMQNILLLSTCNEKYYYSSLNKIKLSLKQAYIRIITRKQYQWIVQTPTIQSKMISKWYIPADKIHILPFFENHFKFSDTRSQPFQFVYVADGVPQKNHTTLLAAWEQLHAKYKFTPTLHLTVPVHFVKLNRQITQLQQKGLSIINHGVINQIQLQQLYHQCAYLLFPSLAESFGLPLIEAVQSGCGVIAADRPYVYDVIEPSATFDPLSADQMASCISNINSENSLKRAKIISLNKVNNLIDLLYETA